MNPESIARPTITTVSTLFAVLVGIALQRMLTGELDVSWLKFLTALAVAVRFLLGSANHLWHEHVRPVEKDKDYEVNRGELTFDISVLVLLGVALAFMAYAPTDAWFFLGGILICLFALGWSWLDAALFPREKQADWSFWRMLDILNLLVFAWGLLAATAVIPMGLPEAWFWGSLAAVNLVIAGLDVRFQLSAVGHARGAGGAPKAGWGLARVGGGALVLLIAVGIISAQPRSIAVDTTDISSAPPLQPPGVATFAFRPGETCSPSTLPAAAVAALVADARAKGSTKVVVVGSEDVMPLGKSLAPLHVEPLSLAWSRAWCVAGRLATAFGEYLMHIDVDVQVRRAADVGASLAVGSQRDRAVAVVLVP